MLPHKSVIHYAGIKNHRVYIRVAPFLYNKTSPTNVHFVISQFLHVQENIFLHVFFIGYAKNGNHEVYVWFGSSMIGLHRRS
jgi:hypothetical protein